MEKITFTSILNNQFEMEGCTYQDYLSVLAPGYIIRPDGLCVIIPDNLDHADVSSFYIHKYLEQKYELYHITDANRILTSLNMNCVVYNGMKIRDAIYKHDTYMKEDQRTGYGLIYLPENSKLTDEQKIACQTLLKSNKSLFGNREKIDLTIGYVDGREVERTTFEEMIQVNQKKL